MKSSVGVIHTGALAFDITAREAEVVGEPPRIKPLAIDEITGEAKQLCFDLAKSFGGDSTGRQFHIPGVLATMLRHPGIYRRQVEMTIQLVGSGAISPRERELAVLRVAWLCRAPYEWGEHVEVAKRNEVTADEIERVTQGSSAAGWSDHQRAIVCAVEELLGNQSISDQTWNALARTWNEAQLMELPVLVGAYYMMALQHNSFKVRLSENNKGLRQR